VHHGGSAARAAEPPQLRLKLTFPPLRAILGDRAAEPHFQARRAVSMDPDFAAGGWRAGVEEGVARASIKDPTSQA